MDKLIQHPERVITQISRWGVSEASEAVIQETYKKGSGREMLERHVLGHTLVCAFIQFCQSRHHGCSTMDSYHTHTRLHGTIVAPGDTGQSTQRCELPLGRYLVGHATVG